jgi:2-polyprenyl-3-methyl-5-hydroxy-6-metoxy-1,4-benzoquinol methylase
LGLNENEAQQDYLRKFIGRIRKGGSILSAACGVGRYDGTLLEAGCDVTGIDQSAGMLARAKEHFPQARSRKMGLQEMDFHEAFDGAICIDALEHVSREDWPGS